MNTLIKSLFLILCFSINLVPNAFAQNNDMALEKAILIKVNEYRQKHGLGALHMNENIAYEARNHSKDMANHTMPFGHKYFKSRVDRLYSQIKNANGAAENVAFNYKTVDAVVSGWIKSSGHRRNLMGNYNLTGIGIARDAQGRMYFTQMFVKTGAGSQAVRTPFFHFLKRISA